MASDWECSHIKSIETKKAKATAMKRELKKINEPLIRRQFQNETGINANEIKEIGEAYPFDLFASIKTQDKTFNFKLTYGGRAKKGSFQEES